jgi:hypothetical protein
VAETATKAPRSELIEEESALFQYFLHAEGLEPDISREIPAGPGASTGDPHATVLSLPPGESYHDQTGAHHSRLAAPRGKAAKASKNRTRSTLYIAHNNNLHSSLPVQSHTESKAKRRHHQCYPRRNRRCQRNSSAVSLTSLPGGTSSYEKYANFPLPRCRFAPSGQLELFYQILSNEIFATQSQSCY